MVTRLARRFQWVEVKQLPSHLMLPSVLMYCSLLLQKPLKYIIIGTASISCDLLLELVIGQIVYLRQLHQRFSGSDRIASVLHTLYMLLLTYFQ